MDLSNDYTDAESIKRLIDEVGWSKALDIITSIEPLYEGDFAVDHKKMYVFSNESTDEINRAIQEEEAKEREMAEQIEA